MVEKLDPITNTRGPNQRSDERIVKEAKRTRSTKRSELIFGLD